MGRKAYAEHRCEKCGSLHKTPQAKFSHKKRCIVTVSSVELQNQVDDLKVTVETLTRTVAALLVQPTTTNITNNTTNITVNAFRKEDLSYIAHEMVRDLIKQKDLDRSLQEMIKLIHFNEKQPQNMNVYLGSMDDKYGKCWKGTEWKDCEVGDLVRLVITNAADVFREHSDEPYEEEYDETETYLFNTFHQNCEKAPGPTKDTKVTFLANKDTVSVYSNI